VSARILRAKRSPGFDPDRKIHCITFGLSAVSVRWNIEACATLFVSESSRTCGRSPFILAALNRPRKKFAEHAKLQNLMLVP
jgi:hypothetical protein